MLAIQKELKEVDDMITLSNQQTMQFNGTLKGLPQLQGSSPEQNLITGLTANHRNDTSEQEAYGSKKGKKDGSFLPPINIKKAKETPMIIDKGSPSQQSNSKDFEYNYHSADKGGVAAQIETSMQSYSRTGIGRHLGSASKQGGKKTEEVVMNTDESSIHDKDDVATNGQGQGTNRVPDTVIENTEFIVADK